MCCAFCIYLCLCERQGKCKNVDKVSLDIFAPSARLPTYVMIYICRTDSVPMLYVFKQESLRPQYSSNSFHFCPDRYSVYKSVLDRHQNIRVVVTQLNGISTYEVFNLFQAIRAGVTDTRTSIRTSNFIWSRSSSLNGKKEMREERRRRKAKATNSLWIVSTLTTVLLLRVQR